MDIKLYDENLEIYGKPIDTFSSLTYTDRWSADGDFKLVLPVEKYNDVKDAAYIYVDGRMFEIAAINTKDASANNQLSLSGHNLNVLLSRVVISTPSRIQGKLETEIRTLVDSLCGSTSWQAIDKFTLGTLHGYARAMDANAMRGSLSDFLYAELNKRGFSFSLTYDDVNDEIVFDIIQSLDRTQDQTDNTFATFSASLGNVQNIEYERNETDYYNCAVVCDEDDTAPQTVIVDLSNGEPKRTIYVSGTSAGADTSAAPNLYVSVGAAGYIATSTDGINWTQRTSNTSEDLWAIDYSNGFFIAGGDGGTIVVSQNAIDWVVRSCASSYVIFGSTYYDGLYIIVDQYGAIFVSYDNETWINEFESGYVGTIKNVVYFWDRFIAYSYTMEDRSVVSILTSTDGFDWKSIPAPSGLSGQKLVSTQACIFSDTVVCAGYIDNAGSYTPFTVVSRDRLATNEINVVTSLSGNRFLDMVSGLGVLVAVGSPNVLTPGIIAYSTDGIAWTNVTPVGSTDWYSVAFDGMKFVAIGRGTRNVAVSTDGMLWSVQSRSPASGYLAAATYGTSSHAMSLYDIGYNALQNYKPVEVIDGEILPDAHPIFETEYKVGDIVDVIDSSRDIIVSKMLTEAQTIYEPKKSIIIPKFGDGYLSLKKYIEKVVDRLV